MEDDHTVTSTTDGPRRADDADADDVVALLVAAFAEDPTWSWAFPDPQRRAAQYTVLWRLIVEGAMRYRTVWLTGGATAASVWVPPGGTDLSPEQEAVVAESIEAVTGAGTERVLLALEAFEQAHPRHEPHWFLSLLGTAPAHRGRGHGFGLLEANLRMVDAERSPAYLEASNPANVPLYERYGFAVHGEFSFPGGGPTVVTMWRDAR